MMTPTTRPGPGSRTRRPLLAGLAALVVGAALGAAGALAVTDGPSEVEAATVSATTERSVDTDGPVACSTYDVPSPESGAIARSTLVDGTPYVIVCDDAAGREVSSQMFVYRDGRRGGDGG